MLSRFKGAGFQGFSVQGFELPFWSRLLDWDFANGVRFSACSFVFTLVAALWGSLQWLRGA